MRTPSVKTIATAAFALFVIGWLYSLKEMNNPALKNLEKKSPLRDLSKLKLALPEHPHLDSFKLINNSPFDLALFIKIVNSDGSIDFMQHMHISPMHKQDIYESPSFELLREKSNDVNQTIVNIEFSAQPPHSVGITSLLKAVTMGGYCLCAAETYEEMKNDTQNSPVVTLCQQMNYTFFAPLKELRQYSSSRHLCGIEEKTSLRGLKKLHHTP